MKRYYKYLKDVYFGLNQFGIVVEYLFICVEYLVWFLVQSKERKKKLKKKWLKRMYRD